jgi:phenylacetate-CoA ligase
MRKPMEHSTMTPPSNLRDYQLQKLRKLLSLQSYNQFYNSEPQTLADIADLSSIEEFAAKIAFTEKQQLISDQLNHPPFGTNLSCHLHQYKHDSHSTALARHGTKLASDPQLLATDLSSCWRCGDRSSLLRFLIWTFFGFLVSL